MQLSVLLRGSNAYLAKKDGNFSLQLHHVMAISVQLNVIILLFLMANVDGHAKNQDFYVINRNVSM